MRQMAAVFLLFCTPLSAESLDPSWFLGAGYARGTHATHTGYPGTPTRGTSAGTPELFLDARTSHGLLSGSLIFPDSPFSGPAWEGQLRVSPFGIGRVRTGIGVQMIEIPKYTYEIPSQAYVRISGWHERRWVSGVADLGIGSYDRNYARALFLYGAIRTPTETDIFLFDRPVVLEHTGFGQAASRMVGIGAQARLEPVRNAALFGSVIRFDRKSKGSALVPDRHWVAMGEASYMTPWHLGVALSGTHATDDIGLAFPNNTLRLRIGLSF